MDFQPTEERRILADMIGKFIQNDYPLKERLTAGSSALGYCPAAYSTMAQLGLIGALFEEEFGGFGGLGFDIATVFTELGKGLVVEPLNDTALTTGYILAQTDQLDLVEQIVLGEKRVALGLIENGADYDWSAPETLARKTDAEWQLNGVKTSVKFAHGADALIVSAQTQSAPGISLFLIDAAATGLAEHPFQTVDGGNACEITLHNTPAQLLGVEGAAYPLIDAAAARATLALCAEALGLMERIKEMTIDYMRTRKQFGSELGKFQALQHRVAQLLLEIEQAKSAVINAANDLQAPADERNRAISAAKYSIGRIGCAVAEEAIQLHGGIGMTWEYDLGHFAKRLVMIDHEWGDQDFHLMRFAES
jgi:alkylation response protein AidB-like acyl-CoA dehydrogenase